MAAGCRKPDPPLPAATIAWGFKDPALHLLKSDSYCNLGTSRVHGLHPSSMRQALASMTLRKWGSVSQRVRLKVTWMQI